MGYVLLTAAVTPDPRFGAALSDPKIRMEQYRRALTFWTAAVAQRDWKVLVVETTGCSVSEMIAGTSAQASKFVEVIPFSPDGSLAQNGKGAIEAAAIDYALNPGRVADAATFYKATGRLTLGNASKLLKDVDEESAIVRRTLDGKYSDTRFFGTTAGFWRRRLGGMATEVNEGRGRYLEHVFAHRLRAAEYGHAAKVRPFSQRPMLVGVSGTTGSSYKGFDGLLRDRLLGPIERSLISRLANKQV